MINYNILLALFSTTLFTLWIFLFLDGKFLLQPHKYGNLITNLDSQRQGAATNPNFRISVLLVYEPNPFWVAILRRSLANHYAYSQRNGYKLVCRRNAHNATTKSWRHIAWMKVNATLDAFRSNDADWVFWTDLDGLIMNHSLKVEALIETASNHDIIVARDCNGINSGHMLIRNSAWSIYFLEKVYRTHWAPNANVWWEQAAVIYWYNNNGRDREHFQLIDPYLLNGYVAPMCNQPYNHLYELGDFVVHFPGVPHRDKAAKIEKYANLSGKLNGYSEDVDLDRLCPP